MFSHGLLGKRWLQRWGFSCCTCNDLVKKKKNSQWASWALASQLASCHYTGVSKVREITLSADMFHLESDVFLADYFYRHAQNTKPWPSLWVGELNKNNKKTPDNDVWRCACRRACVRGIKLVSVMAELWAISRSQWQHVINLQLILIPLPPGDLLLSTVSDLIVRL